MNSAQSYVDYKIQALEDLLAEIESEGYTTVSQVKGAINNDIEHTKKAGLMVGTVSVTSFDYDKEAKADHFSSEQFPNV